MRSAPENRSKTQEWKNNDRLFTAAIERVAQRGTTTAN